MIQILQTATHWVADSSSISVNNTGKVQQARLRRWWLLSLLLTGLTHMGWAQTPCFSTSTSLAVGTNPQYVATGDFNGDSKPDLVVVNTGSNNVSILINTGTGNFGAATTFPVGSSPQSVVVGDFNKDNSLDLAVANRYTNNVSVLLGTGTGSFGTAINFTVESAPYSIGAGDFNGDSNLDIVVTNISSNSISVLLGTGTGSFGSAINTTTTAGNVWALAVGDLNGDAKLDVAVTDGLNPRVLVFLGLGTGSFGTATQFPVVGSDPQSVAIADFNGDSYPDLVVTGQYNYVSMLLGTGTGSFGTASVVGFFITPQKVIVGDFNKDTKPDLAVADRAGTVYVELNRGNGAFNSASTTALNVPGGSYAVAMGDFNGDGKPDLATANQAASSSSIFYNCTVPANLSPVVANPIAPQSATVGQAYSFTVPANTFSDPNGDVLTYTASGLPSGLTFTAPGTISGTPSVSGVSTVRIIATDPGSLSAVASFTLTTVLAPLTLTFTASPTTLLTTGSTTLLATVSGGAAPYTYTFSGPGTITPSGNSASVSGLSAGIQTFTLVATDVGSQSITATVSVTVSTPVPPPTVVAPIASQTVTSGQPYTFMIPANTFSSTTGNVITYAALGLPAGLTFTPPSSISGIPTVTGTFTVTIVATDTGVPANPNGQPALAARLSLNGQVQTESPSSSSASAQFTITIGTTLIPLTMTLTATPTQFLGTGSTSLSAVVTGGSSPYSYTFSGPGTITPTGNSATVSGLTAGVQTFTVIAQDVTIPTSQSVSATVSVTVNAAPIAPSLPNQIATQGTLFSYVVPAFTGTAPITYAASGLPTGLSFDAGTRTISGTPSMTGVSTVLISASNGLGQSSGQFTITVSASATQPTGPATLTITSFNCFSTNGALSSVNFVVGYNNGTFAPALPNLFINGVTITGQLGQTYTFSFDSNTGPLSIQDQASRSTYFVWNYRAACAGPVTPPTPTAPVAPGLPNQAATQGTPFSYVVPAFTGTAPITYAASGLPAGLSFDAGTRTISGTPSLTGVSTVLISASNGVGQSSATFTITVSASAIQPTSPAALTITSFNCFSTNGALSSVNFVVGYSNGTFTPALPALFINGVTITGQLGQTYTFPFDAGVNTLTIQDQASRTTYFVWNFRQACAGPVTPPTPTAPVAPGLPNQAATQGTPFSYVVPAFTGTAPITYVASGLPTGLSFDAGTRTISGTPSLTGVSTVLISASNGVGQSSATFTITVSASAVAPVGPAALTITSFNCFSTNGALSSVNFVVGYRDGTFTPTLPALFINGVTITGQLGQPYTFSFDANVSMLPIQDQANRTTYFVWNFRQACASRPSPARMSVEPASEWQVRLLGNPVHDKVDVEVTGAEGASLNLFLTDMQGHLVGQRQTEKAGATERYQFSVSGQSAGPILLRVSTGTQSKTVRILKVD